MQTIMLQVEIALTIPVFGLEVPRSRVRGHRGGLLLMLHKYCNIICDFVSLRR
jgi:hypothetical protein